MQLLRPFVALYLAVFFLQMGFSLLGTFLSLRLTVEGVSSQVTGMVMTAYYLGLVIGTLYCRRLIRRIGHIRAFAAFAAAITAMAMVHGSAMNPVLWGVLRFFAGIAAMGLFMVIESWLNECTPVNSRGAVFSIYMIMTFMGMGLGQQILRIGNVETNSLLMVTGFLVVCSIIPVSVTGSIHPELPKIEKMPFSIIVRTAPIGILGCFTAGLLNSAFYSMGAVFGHRIGLDVTGISMYMTAMILGGLILQYPIGQISDRFDRSLVLPFLGAGVAAMSVLVFLLPKEPFWILGGVSVFFGGFVFSLYPVSVARAHDMFDSSEIVNVSSALLLTYGVGAIIGPLAAAAAMSTRLGPYALYVFFFLASLAYALIVWLLRAKEIVSIVPVDEQVDFMIMKNTSAVALEIDPRTDTGTEA